MDGEKKQASAARLNLDKLDLNVRLLEHARPENSRLEEAQY
jgi:hypothetical protein